MRSSVDFLGNFYETFLRYGSDNKQLGIVFTPRHITRLCAELVNVELGMTVYDPACGTGGFLVAAYDKMMTAATTRRAIQTAKSSLFGFDTSSTVWALAVLNMIFRGDGKSHIALESCFDKSKEMEGRFDRVLLNPPFSQDDEPERDFIDHSLNSLKAGGEIAVVVPTGVLVDAEHKEWRKNLVSNHKILGTISMPTKLFYPTGSATSILIVKAHVPKDDLGTFMAKIHNDGYTISKNRRIPISGSQLREIIALFQNFRLNQFNNDIPGLACKIERTKIIEGEEICAEKWLPQPPMPENQFGKSVNELLRQIYMTVVNYPSIVEMLIDEFSDLCAGITAPAQQKPATRSALKNFFKVSPAKSIGLSNYPSGETPFISSGESYNSIVGFISAPPEEVFDTPCITVTAFGRAHVQPWKFCARGNGGSAVRVIEPLFPMTVAELLWFACQINFQKWRFHYGRMAILSRLSELKVDPYPGHDIGEIDLIDRIRTFATRMSELLPGEP